MASDDLTSLANSGAAAEKKNGSTVVDDPQTSCAGKKSWIEIQLVGEGGKGIPDEPYCIVLPSGEKRSGKTDVEGLARVEGIDSSEDCKISFPDLDQDEWETI